MNEMGLMERLANLSLPTVVITVLVLLGIRFALGKHPNKVVRGIAETAESLAIAMALVFLLIKPFIVQSFYIPSDSMMPTLRQRDHLMVNKFLFRFREPKPGEIIVFRAPAEASQDHMEHDFIKRVVAVPGDVVRVTGGYLQAGEEQIHHQTLRLSLSGYAERGKDGFVKLTDSAVLMDGKPIPKSDLEFALGLKPGTPLKFVPGKVIVNNKTLDEPFIAEDPDQDYPILTEDPYSGNPTPRTPQEWLTDDNGKTAVRIPPGRLLVMGDNRNNSNDARFWGLLERSRVMGKAWIIFWPLNRIRWIH